MKLNNFEKFFYLTLLYALVVIIENGFVREQLIHFTILALTGLLMHWVFSKFTKTRPNWTQTGITVLILFLIIWPQISVLAIILNFLTLALVLAIKLFARYKMRTVINPAATALLAVGLFVLFVFPEHFYISWWGMQSQSLLQLLVLLGILVFALFKIRRGYIIAAFAVPTVVALGLYEWQLIEFLVLNAAMLFFVAVMLIEVKSTPVIKKQQILYGLLSAAIFVPWLIFHLPFPYLSTIVIANLVFFAYVVWNSKHTAVKS